MWFVVNACDFYCTHVITCMQIGIALRDFMFVAPESHFTGAGVPGARRELGAGTAGDNFLTCVLPRPGEGHAGAPAVPPPMPRALPKALRATMWLLWCSRRCAVPTTSESGGTRVPAGPLRTLPQHP